MANYDFTITEDPYFANAVTHAGPFHADELLATAILMRERQKVVLLRCDAVPLSAQVRGAIIYDIGHGKYDHHQASGGGVRENGVPYASAGLIWRKCGRKILKDYKESEKIYSLVDQYLVQGVDATDNGTFKKVKYPVQNMCISKMLSYFNPTWDSDQYFNDAFKEAVEFVGVVLDKLIARAAANSEQVAKYRKISLESVFSTVILAKFYEEFLRGRTDITKEEYVKEFFADAAGATYGCRENGIPYTSVGILWSLHGRKIAKNHNVWNNIERELIQPLDATISNVMPVSDYPAQNLTIRRIVDLFNPLERGKQAYYKAHEEAVQFCTCFFEKMLNHGISAEKAVPIVEQLIEEAEDNIIIMEKYISWKDALLQSNNPKAKDILFVVYPSARGKKEEYIWQGVPEHLGTKSLRKKVPPEWWGASSFTLRELTGIESAMFCHNAGFIGGASTKKGAVALVKLAINS